MILVMPVPRRNTIKIILAIELKPLNIILDNRLKLGIFFKVFYPKTRFIIILSTFDYLFILNFKISNLFFISSLIRFNLLLLLFVFLFLNLCSSSIQITFFISHHLFQHTCFKLFRYF